jgi:hypothetical protein
LGKRKKFVKTEICKKLEINDKFLVFIFYDVVFLIAKRTPQVVCDRQEIVEGFAFRCVEEDEIFAASMSIGSGERMGFRLSFLKYFFPTFFLLLLTCSIFRSPLLHFPLLGRRHWFCICPSVALLLASLIFD